MRTLASIFMLQFVIFVLSGCCAASMPEAKVIAKVIDDTGKPVPDAEVTIYFQYNGKPIRIGLGGGCELISNHAIGKSNANGIFEGTGASDENVWTEARKIGYYSASSKSIDKPTRNVLLNRWQPWPLKQEVVLKKQRNPVPMYRKIERALTPPVFKQPIGYDLELGDWVMPYGKGKTSDFFCTFQKQSVDKKNYYTSSLTFPEQLDGIQEYKHPQNDHSHYEWPFEAPENGYINKFTGEAIYKENEGQKSNTIPENTKYIFRVRTKTDIYGKITSACYGKIERIALNWEGLHFIYAFNPDGTRNIEEDPKQNLFDRVKSTK